MQSVSRTVWRSPLVKRYALVFLLVAAAYGLFVVQIRSRAARAAFTSNVRQARPHRSFARSKRKHAQCCT